MTILRQNRTCKQIETRFLAKMYVNRKINAIGICEGCDHIITADEYYTDTNGDGLYCYDCM